MGTRATAAEESVISSQGEFQYLFAGNDQAHYVWNNGAYDAVDRGIMEADVTRHLRGELPALLSIPIMQSGLVHFACMDCDRHGEGDVAIDHKAVALKISELGLPLIICRSKSPKSAHIWLFFKERDGFDAATARRLVEKYTRVLGIGGTIEIFPKQEALKEGQLGSGINLPYFSGERIAFGADGEPLDLEAFIALAHLRAAYGCKLAERDLADTPSESSASSAGNENRPMTVKAIRAIHQGNLMALAASNVEGHWNDTINKTAYWAARAFAAEALEGTADSIRADIIKAAAASSSYNERQLEATLNSGWDSGLLVPLKIKPSIKNPIDIEDGLEAFCYFQENYFVVKDFGGHFRIMYLEAEEHPAFKGRLRLGHTTKDDFIKGYEHLTVKETETEGEEETKDVPIVNYWLYARNRRQYSRIVFAPGVDLGPSVMNLWVDSALCPRQGIASCSWSICIT